MDAGPSGSAGGRASGGGWDRLDGRLDLDNLDDDAPLDLDVLAHDDEGPGWLERSGVLPWMREHPALTTTAVVVLGAVLVAPAVVRALGPQPLSDRPKVSVTNGGNESARLTLDPETGHVTEISQLVLVTSDEPADVTVETIGVVGPGLTDPRSRILPTTLGSPTTGGVRSSLDCGTAEQTTAVIAATARDYAVSLNLASSTTGEVRSAQVPLQGAEEWLSDIRRACVQIAADRDLQVAAVRTSPVEGNVAADVQLLLRSTATVPWQQVHVSTTGGPTVVAAGEPVDVPVDGSAWLPVRLWPDDCADPVGPLKDGVPLRAAFSDGGAMTEARSPTFLLRLDRASIDRIARTLQTVCTGDVPTVDVVSAGINKGGSATSAGTIDMVLRLRTEDSGMVEVVDPLAATGGRVSPVVTPVPVVDGSAELKVLWTVPQCFDLLQGGGPVLKVRLASDLRRPYAIPLRGEGLRENLQRLCGTTVASTVR